MNKTASGETGDPEFMLRIITSASINQAKKYYSEGLTREGYYSEGQEMAGEWGGLCADRLGLKGTVDKDVFTRLCDNIHPVTGQPLTPRMKENRRVGYDFNFNAPKSVSLAYEWSKDERILSIFRKAVRETMEELEHDVGTRVRVDGRNEDRVTGNLLWAEFIHFTARPVDGIPDPHLHAHCFAFNATFDQTESRWKAAQFGDIKYDANYYQAAFHARLSNGLRELGYEIEPVGGAFELGGISRSLIEKFSRRSEVVKTKEKELGDLTAKERDGLAALTREKKAKDLSKTELHALWWERLSPEDTNELNALGAHLERRRYQELVKPEPKQNKEAVAFALEHIFERASVVSERELITEALKWGYGRATLAGVRAEVNSLPLIRVEHNGQKLLTTPEVLKEEKRIVERCQRGKGKYPTLHSYWHIQDKALNAQQKEAVFHVLRSRDFITGIAGKAGTGKTTLLHEAKRGIEAGGNKLMVFAPTAEAARGVLRKQGFAQAETVAQLLSSATLQEQAMGAVWWVDEAGLMSARSMDRLMGLAEKLDARLVLVGDTGQHHSVERGSPFDLMERYGKMEVAGVEIIQRQKGAYKRAVEQIAERNFAAAFDILEKMGAFRELPILDRENTLARDYQRAFAKGKSVLVVSPTHAECESATQAIRRELKEREIIGEGVKWRILYNQSWTAAEKRDSRSYTLGLVAQITRQVKGFALGEQLEVMEISHRHVVAQNCRGESKKLPLNTPEVFSVYKRDAIEVSAGDRIRITANGRSEDRHRLNNGDLHTVKAFTRAGDIVLDNGWHLGRDFGHLDYGYATTSHSSQGKTVDWVFVAQSGLCTSGASDANQFYVSVSRGRKGVTIYTDDTEALRENVARVRERMNAMEIMPKEKSKEDLSRAAEAKIETQEPLLEITKAAELEMRTPLVESREISMPEVEREDALELER